MLAKPADVSAANYKAVGNANQWFWFCNADAAQEVDTKETGTPANDKRFMACKMADPLFGSYVVDLQVEMQSKPCQNPNDHPVPGDATTNTIYNLLK